MKRHNFNGCGVCNRLGIRSDQDYQDQYSHEEHGIKFTDEHWEENEVSISVIDGLVFD